MPSYSTTVQGASPLNESHVLKDDSGPVLSEVVAPGDVPNTTQDAEPVSAPAESVVALGVPEPTVFDDTKPVDAPSEELPGVFDPSLGQPPLVQSVEIETERPKSPWTPSHTVTTLPDSGSIPLVDSKPELDETPTTETEAEVPPVENAEAVETPKIVTPADEQLPGPAATTETPWARSYSVTSQPGSPRLSPKVGLGELESEPQPVGPIQETPTPIVELANVPKTVVTPAVEGEGEHVARPEQVPEEESKPAWIQSYTIISQPGSPRVPPKRATEEVPEAEESPTWTQSYYVTPQPGSPRVLPKEGLPEPTADHIVVTEQPTMIVTPPVEEVTPAVAETEAPERPKSPQTPSYSVTTLENQTKEALPQDAEPELETAPIPKAFVREAPAPAPEVDPPIKDVPSSEPLAVEDEQPERPKSPWTPSYSVTTLPGTTPAKESEPGPAAPPVDVEVPAPEPIEVAKVVEDQQKDHGATSDVFEVHEAVARLAVHDEPQVDAKIPEPAPLQLDLVSYGLVCQTIRSVLIIVSSPSQTLPLGSRRSPAGLLRTQPHNFQG